MTSVIIEFFEKRGEAKGVGMKALKNKQGVSLIFVLVSLLLLMALGVSVLTAAGLSHGAVNTQRFRNQLNMYAGSMERVLAELLIDSSTLGGRIVHYALNEHFGTNPFDDTNADPLFHIFLPNSTPVNPPTNPYTITNPIIINTDFDGDINGAIYGITITGQISGFVVSGFRYDPDAEYSFPPSATQLFVFGWIDVIQRTTLDSGGGFGLDNFFVMETITRFELNTADMAEFIEVGYGTRDTAPSLEDMVIKSPIQWEMVRRHVTVQN